jgi:hypothetical protein
LILVTGRMAGVRPAGHHALPRRFSIERVPAHLRQGQYPSPASFLNGRLGRPSINARTGPDEFVKKKAPPVIILPVRINHQK